MSGVRAFLVALAAAATLLVAWTVCRGQDVNWDWQNYHSYDVYALLHGRLRADVAPAGPQSFLNPLPYLIPYLARRLLPPMAGGVVVALTQLMPVMLTWALAWRCWGDRMGRGWVAAIAAVCACTGSVVLTEAGTSFCDVVLAAPSLLGLLLILPRSPADSARALRLLVSGIAVGVAVGVKPTNVFLLPAAVAAVLAARTGAFRTRLSAVLVLLSGAVLGGLLSDGLWALWLWREFASPVFPFMNSLFHAPSAARVTFSDKRYHWQGFGHALALPFALARGTAATSEFFIRDVRFAIALPLAAAILLLRPSTMRTRLPSDPLVVLSAWLVTGSFFWLLLCPIQRYAAALEMVAAVTIVVAVARAVPERCCVAMLLVCLLILAGTTRSADFFHRPWSSPFAPRVPDGVAAGSTYGVLTFPLAYWVAVRPAPANAFSLHPGLLQTGGRLQRRLDGIISRSRDELWLIDLDMPVIAAIRDEMGKRGLAMAPPCLRTASPTYIDTVFCRGRFVGSRAYGASDLAPNDTIRFTPDSAGLMYEIDGWDVTMPDGTWANASAARLAFHASASPMVLVLTMSGVHGAPPHHVKAWAGGGVPVVWNLQNAGPSEHFLCIGAARLPGDVVMVELDTDDIRSLMELGTGPEQRHLAFMLHSMELRAAGPGACGM